MFEEAKKPPLLMSDIKPTPLWVIFKSAFWTLSPRPSLAHKRVFPWNESRPKTFKKTVVTYMQVMAKGDIQVQSLGNFSNLWFRPVISSQWKVKRHIFWTFMIKFCPYFGKISKVALQSCNFVQHNQFCLKRAKIWHPISQEWMGIFKKKLTGVYFPYFVQNIWK